MAETGREAENPKIPANWQFPEKNKGIQVVEIDSKRNYLKAEIPEGLDKDPFFRVNKVYLEYFFSPDGLPSQARKLYIRQSNHFFLIIGRFGELDVEFTFSGKYSNEKVKGVSRGEILNNPDCDLLQIGFNNPNDKAEDGSSMLFDAKIASIVHIMFGRYFRLKDGSFIKGPLIATPAGALTNPQEREEYRQVLLDPKWKKKFCAECNFLVREESDGGEVEYVVFSQTHLPSQSTRILESPTHIDMEKVKAVAFSAGEEWKEVERTVGASLTYSYPLSS